MKRTIQFAFMAIPLMAMCNLAHAQATRTRTGVITGAINSSPAGITQLQAEGFLITQNSITNPAAADFTGSFSATARWNSMGNLNAGTQTLNGFRTQTRGRALATGHSVLNATNVTSNPFIQWIGNSSVGVTPGALEFKFALNPGGVGLPATDVTLFNMVPNAAGTAGDSYAVNGTLGHLQNGNFGDISGLSQWLGHGPAKIAGVLDPNIYGNRIQQGAQSMLFNLVSGKPVVGWGDQGQDMVFRYFPNRFQPSQFNDILTLQSNGRSSFGSVYTNTPKVSIRGDEPNGLEILLKNNGSNTQIGGDATIITAFQNSIGFWGKAQSDGSSAPFNTVLNNTGVRGEAGVNGSPQDLVNIGVYGEANPNSNNSKNFGVYGTCPSSTVAAFTAGGYFIGGLYTDGVIVMSDQTLKSNITNETDISSRIMQLRPVNYLMDKKRAGYNFSDKLQHGFIAQEMETIFPELVNNIEHPIPEGGTTRFEKIKGVNYIGLISVLTRGMQEQMEKFNRQETKMQEMEREIQSLKQALVTAVPDNARPDTKAALDKVAGSKLGFELNQNVPNPFSEYTTIAYSIPVATANASVVITDLNGRILKQFNNLQGKSQIRINASELPAGIYLYSLISSGQEVITKRMVLNK